MSKVRRLTFGLHWTFESKLNFFPCWLPNWISEICEKNEGTSLKHFFFFVKEIKIIAKNVFCQEHHNSRCVNGCPSLGPLMTFSHVKLALKLSCTTEAHITFYSVLKTTTISSRKTVTEPTFFQPFFVCTLYFSFFNTDKKLFIHCIVFTYLILQRLQKILYKRLNNWMVSKLDFFPLCFNSYRTNPPYLDYSI